MSNGNIGLLVVDDEEAIRHAIRRALLAEPFEVFSASTGHEAIDLIKHEHVALVISDYKMPGMDGLKILQIIGELDPSIVRVLLTGYATLEMAVQATNEGIDGFMTKPFTNEDLKQHIRNFFLRGVLKRYVPHQVISQIGKNPNSVKLEGKKQEATVMFTDIRGFTHITSHFTPEELLTFLNRNYFSPLTDVAIQHDGMIDKYIGDSIMLVFGVPLETDDHAQSAVETAIDMQKTIREINNKERPDMKRVPIHVGIGIATGELVSGNIGSRMRMEYTVFGNTVNMASRLQAMARGGEIIISEETFRRLKPGFNVEKLEALYVKNVNQPVHTYRIIY